jgi:hypothetical protein
MKLSEAILLGSALSPQAAGSYERNGQRCALGSALAAVGEWIGSEEEVQLALDRLWPHLAMPAIICPVCKALPYDLGVLIIHLNDEHFWTREQIAAHVAQFDPLEVASLEPQDEQADGGPGPGVASLKVPAS